MPEAYKPQTPVLIPNQKEIEQDEWNYTWGDEGLDVFKIFRIVVSHRKSDSGAIRRDWSVRFRGNPECYELAEAFTGKGKSRLMYVRRERYQTTGVPVGQNRIGKKNRQGVYLQENITRYRIRLTMSGSKCKGVKEAVSIYALSLIHI